MNKIMLIEDDATMRSLLKTLLELEGYQVVNYNEADGQEIFDAIKSTHPKALIMDVHLRSNKNVEISGVEVLKRIRNEPALSDIKILMASGMDMRKQCIENGADSFLLKPFMPEELIGWLKIFTTN